MASEKSWRKPLLKERNDKICRLWKEGMNFTILAKRFGLSKTQIRIIVEERKVEEGVRQAVGDFAGSDADEAGKEARANDSRSIEDAWRIYSHGQKVL